MKKLIAFELDDRAVPLLKEEFAEQAERFEIIEADILKIDLDSVSEKEDTKLRVVGNIPYYITSPILFKLMDERDVVRDATLLVQLEVAERLTADPRTKEYGIPTVLANFFGEVKFLFKVPAGAFKPKPNVDSAVIHLDLADRVALRRKVGDDLFERLAGGRWCGFGMGGQGEGQDACGEKAGRHGAHCEVLSVVVEKRIRTSRLLPA